jgi:hypothetical protein
MKHVSAKIRKKVKIKFINAIMRLSQVEDQRDRSMRMYRDQKRKDMSSDKD